MFSVHTGSHKILRRFAPVHIIFVSVYTVLIIDFCRFTLTENLGNLNRGGVEILWEQGQNLCKIYAKCMQICTKYAQKYSQNMRKICATLKMGSGLIIHALLLQNMTIFLIGKKCLPFQVEAQPI